MFRALCNLAAAGLLTVLVATAQEGQVEIKTIPVRGNVYMLMGQGGNMGLCVGDDGAFLIDDQFAPLTEKIRAAIAKLTDKPVRFLINTHWHFDHTGGNENFGRAGSIIVAHENVRKRLSTDQFMKAFNRTVPASPKAALPIVTFHDGVTFHYNEETIDVFHVAPAHTDGDSIIYFQSANVMHMGDTYFNGIYPFIDAGAGGSIDGMIAAIDSALKRANKNTKFIPGHGELSGPDALRDFQSMLKTVSQRMHKLIDEGKSRDEIIAAKPTKDLDEKWGRGFMEPDTWVGIVYDSIKHD
jgi:glyoxylase-like metal-dependent hydrolase (beta-lactamase superfamily II)